MSNPVSAPKASFARNNDFFVYKRIRDVAEFTEASSLGAVLTLCGGAIMFLLFILELVAYLTVTARQELVLAPHSAEPVRKRSPLCHQRVLPRPFLVVHRSRFLSTSLSRLYAASSSR